MLLGEHGADQADYRGTVGAPLCQDGMFSQLILWDGRVGAHGLPDGRSEVTHEVSAGFSGALAFGSLAGQIGLGERMPAGLRARDGVEGAVELAVAALVESVPLSGAAGGRHGRHAGAHGERGSRWEPVDVLDLAEQLAGD